MDQSNENSQNQHSNRISHAQHKHKHSDSIHIHSSDSAEIPLRSESMPVSMIHSNTNQISRTLELHHPYSIITREPSTSDSILNIGLPTSEINLPLSTLNSTKIEYRSKDCFDQSSESDRNDTYDRTLNLTSPLIIAKNDDSIQVENTGLMYTPTRSDIHGFTTFKPVVSSKSEIQFNSTKSPFTSTDSNELQLNNLNLSPIASIDTMDRDTSWQTNHDNTIQWEQHTDESGNMYFYNNQTKESSWHPPPPSALNSVHQDSSEGERVNFKDERLFKNDNYVVWNGINLDVRYLKSIQEHHIITQGHLNRKCIKGFGHQFEHWKLVWGVIVPGALILYKYGISKLHPVKQNIIATD